MKLLLRLRIIAIVQFVIYPKMVSLGANALLALVPVVGAQARERARENIRDISRAFKAGDECFGFFAKSFSNDASVAASMYHNWLRETELRFASRDDRDDVDRLRTFLSRLMRDDTLLHYQRLVVDSRFVTR